MKISLSITPVLYHLTTDRKAASIAEKDRFELKPADGSEFETRIAKTSYYLSTARHKLGSYTRNGISSSSVILVLDGVKLGTKYSSEPVDYWANYYTADPFTRERMEAEDRIYSRTPFITPASRYISEIHCMLSDEPNRLLKIKRFALKHKIPIFFYKETKDLLLLDVRKTVPFDVSKMMPEKTRNPSEYEYLRKNTNALSGWLQLYEQKPNLKNEPGKDWNKPTKYLTEQAKRCYDNLPYLGSPNNGPVQVLDNDIHNEKGTKYGDLTRGREDLDRLIAILRKHRWTNYDFCKYLCDRWNVRREYL